MISEPTKAKAIVTYPPVDGKAVWKMENVTLAPLGDNDVLVRIVASGICHTDLVFSSYPEESGTYPRVLGHEGAGYVEKIGSLVKTCSLGDPVLLSFSSCTTCQECSTGHPAYCVDFNPLNYFAVPDLFRSAAEPERGFSGKYFGQSSFASFTTVNATSVVSVKGLVRDEEELRLLAPLGCGLQTGAGAVTQIAGAGKWDEVVVLGLGGVGLAAVMAAKIRGCLNIIGVDRFDSRLELAKSLGATHTINTSGADVDLVAAVKSLTGGRGATVTIDTTGNMGVIKQGFEATGTRGQMLIIGVPPADAELGVHLITLLQTGKQLRGCIEGDVTPSKYVPQMIQWFREGKFPIDKIATFYPAEEYMKALADMKAGTAIKPILTW